MDRDAAAPEFLTTREVAALLRVKERKVYDLAAAGAIPCRRVTGKLLFPRTEIEAWLGGGHAAPDPARRGAGALARRFPHRRGLAQPHPADRGRVRRLFPDPAGAP